MKHLHLPLILLLCLAFHRPALTQKLDHAPGHLLVRLSEDITSEKWAARWQTISGKATGLSMAEQLSPSMNIWLVTFDPAAVDERHLLTELRRKDPDVLGIQFDHWLYPRSTQPDDPQFSNQWQYINTGQDGGNPGADLDIDQAWDITTGGLTALGDTIVVCVIDDGLDLEHEDFGGNLWINHAEIPGNGVDDDQNGYIDDRLGWNVRRNNDRIDDGNTHGTPVAGIIGARGNNGRGVAGVNWNVKLMIVVGGIGASLESDYIKAFEYPLRQRKLYNASEGKEGAFVVATNGSWGVDTAKVEDFPLWSAFYDTLGVHGILNVGAVTNNNDTDIDQKGDMPASSPSSYLLTVTNIDNRDQKVAGAGFGAISVDLGAYGGNASNGTWTTKNNNTYGRFPGTSAATPHVAGAVGLLYSAPCSSFAGLARTDPSGAAQLIRSVILDGAQPVASLAGRTVTGGKLNVFNSLQLLLQECVDCFPASTLLVLEEKVNDALLSWNINDSISQVDLRWRKIGEEEWTLIGDVQSPYRLTGLQGCTDYEWQLNTVCGDAELGFGGSQTFRTDGCCSPPENIRTLFKSEDRLFLRWDQVTAAIGYQARIRAEGTEVWDTVAALRDGNVAITGLTPCTNYEIQVLTRCQGQNSEFGQSYWVQTTGCGFCIDMADSYCKVSNVNGTEEWIARVQLNTLDHATGGGSGYRDYSGLESTTLRLGNAYNITVSPGFAGSAQGRYTEVYIDFNQDGIFSSSESVFASARSSAAVTGEISVPAGAKPGLTRMRVSMLAQPNIGPCPGSSGQIGEVEDYCVLIDSSTPTVDIDRETLSLIVFPNPFEETFSIRVESPVTETDAAFVLVDAMGRSLRRWERDIPAGNFEESFSLSDVPAGVYWLVLRGVRSGRVVRRLVKQ